MGAPHFTYVIIGAGPTGIGAAHRLKSLGVRDFIVLEQAGKAGGLASSFIDAQGFTWDIGGHVQFSHYPYFDAMMDAAGGEDGWLTHRRSAWAWMCGRFVPYPVQNHLRHLPPWQRWACLRGLLRARRHGAPRDFREWILATFGPGLAGLFMFPYNKKVWACAPEEMSYQWIGERVAVTGLGKALRNIVLGADDAAWGPNSHFRFPKTGGTGGIWERAGEQVGHEHFVFGCRVQEIDYDKKEIRCDGGAVYHYRHLISTMPVSLLCNMLRPALHPGLLAEAGGLRHASANIVGLGLKGRCPEHLRGKSWMYFPESNCPFYRATVFSNYSPANVPDPERYWSLMTETSESPHKPVDHATLAADTVRGCIATGLIGSAQDVHSTWVHRAEHGYPVPTLRRDGILRAVMPQLERLDIYSRGRFGGWKYEVSNQDHSLMQGVEAVDRLTSGAPETVYRWAD